jgi:hypothetical protein
LPSRLVGIGAKSCGHPGDPTLGALRYEKQAERLRETIVRLCRNEGFYEYCDPLTGMGHGSDFFSWTAALLLDVLLENRKILELRGKVAIVTGASSGIGGLSRPSSQDLIHRAA